MRSAPYFHCERELSVVAYTIRMKFPQFLAFLAMLVPLLAADSTAYIVHWTSQEKCYECTTRYAIVCADGQVGCGVPMKTVDHFEICASKEFALKTANLIGEPAKQTDQEWITSTLGGVPQGRKHGTVVAIFEAHKLPIKIKSEEREIQQPPKKETAVTISLP